MSDEIVKYSNQFNNQALRKFTALDLDLLMAIASRVRDKGTDEVAFTFEELKRLAGLQRNMTNDEFAKQIANVNRHCSRSTSSSRTKSTTSSSSPCSQASSPARTNAHSPYR